MNESNQHPEPVNKKLGQIVSQIWDEATQETRSLQVRPSREWFEHLPDVNRWLLGSGGVCLALGMFCLIGIPIVSAAGNQVKVAIHPYTAAGKQEACLSNLQRINAALNQYRQDYEGKYPPAEYKQNGKRITWMTLLKERGLDANAFRCPANRSTRGDGESTGGYAFNSILYGTVIDSSESDEPSRMIVVAERGNLHDTSLLPPYSLWNKKLSSETTPEEATNLSPNHSHNSVAVLYTDGHVDAQTAGPWMAEGDAWGGQILRHTGVHLLQDQYPLLAKIHTTGASGFRNQKQKLRQSLNKLYQFQNETQGYRFLGDEVEESLWRGAYYLSALGDRSFETQLNNDLHKHSHDLLSQVESNWQKYESEFGFLIEYPAAWNTHSQSDGRYLTTYFKSESPHVMATIELGERSTPTTATTIDWTGMENAQKARYGKHYKRISMGTTTLGGHYASTWEFEVRRPNAPKIRKRYVGYSTVWSSVILVASAPAAEWKDWQKQFTHMERQFQMVG